MWLRYGDEEIQVSLKELPLNITYRKYWHFCRNGLILALNTIRYKLGFYIFLTLMNDHICLNESIIWYHTTIQPYMIKLTFSKRRAIIFKLRYKLDIGAQLFWSIFHKFKVYSVQLLRCYLVGINWALSVLHHIIHILLGATCLSWGQLSCGRCSSPGCHLYLSYATSYITDTRIGACHN